MENPSAWQEAERVIERVLEEFYDEQFFRPDLVGLSLPKRIADALREAGLLNDR